MNAATVDFQGLVRAGILEIGDGYRAKNDELGIGGPIFLRSAYLQDVGFVLKDPERFSSEVTPRFGPKIAVLDDVVITTKGNSTGRVGRIGPREVGAVYSPHLSYWRSHDRRQIDQDFLYYWSRGAEFRNQLIGMSTSTDMAPYLSLRDQLSLKITLPPVDEQKFIGRSLRSIDDKIELNRRMNETLEAMAQAIFRDWFVDFGPVRRKLAGVIDPIEIMGGLTQDPVRAAELAGLFPGELATDGLPEGWRIDPLRMHIANFDSKRVPISSGERAKRLGSFPYYGAASAMGTIDDFLFDGVFLLIGEDGSVVRAAGLGVSQYVWGKFWVNNHAHVLQGAGSVSTEQLLLYFNDEPVEPYVTGAVQMKLSQGRMGTMPFVYAGELICRQFSSLIAPLFDRLRAAADESRSLAETRDYLLPRLMSGEVRVGDLAREMAA